MEYRFIIEIVMKMLRTDLLYIFYSKSGYHHQVHPVLDDPQPIPNRCSADCLPRINWIPTDMWEKCPMSDCIEVNISDFAGVVCIPFSDNFLIVFIQERPDEDLLKLIKEALELHMREINLSFELKQKEIRERTLFELHQRLVGKIAFEDLLNEMLLFIKDSLGYHNCAILLCENETNHLKIVASINYPEEVVKEFEITLDEGITGYAAKHNEIVLIYDVREDPRYIMSSGDARSEIALPLRVHGQVIGVLDVESDKVGFFTENDRLLLEPFAHILAVAIENAKLYKSVEQRNLDLKSLFFQTIEALAEVIEAKDPYTRGHVTRSGYLGELLAKKMGMNEKEIEEIKLGCILHDIGKIGVPETILLKKGPLDSGEREEMKQHPTGGVQIIRGISQLDPVQSSILFHHERYDGMGYPDGEKGPSIPTGARIVAVVDAFDAMITDRPYRKRKTLEDTIDELIREKGKQFDPEIVDLFVDWLRDRDNEHIITRIRNGENPAVQ